MFGICAGLMAIISRGVEAPVAFHIANNVPMTVNTLMAGGEAFAIDDDVPACRTLPTSHGWNRVRPAPFGRTSARRCGADKSQRSRGHHPTVRTVRYGEQ
ncbi:hypothetical protein ABGB07_32365 [Micromonosporaceae bacterium B7E4]